mmetsp:Transcript_29337/g.70745  ORF Transcript_29337/g.70745 Transcript_29337/m.70745 type:complete len:150 (+) Transcript_29337:602-1051(+)
MHGRIGVCIRRTSHLPKEKVEKTKQVNQNKTRGFKENEETRWVRNFPYLVTLPRCVHLESLLLYLGPNRIINIVVCEFHQPGKNDIAVFYPSVSSIYDLFFCQVDRSIHRRRFVEPPSLPFVAAAAVMGREKEEEKKASFTRTSTTGRW